MFIDTAEIEIVSGDGGSGLLSFHRTKSKPRGGPDGGDGGDGGDVIIIADEGLHTLMDTRYKRKYVAGNGKHGGSNNRTGAKGRNVTIRVPCGTLVIDADSDELLADLTENGQTIIAAKGGKGGWGNTRFKTSTNRAPRKYTPGEEGETKRLRLELKLLADVGLVGKPNAGKSTLLSVISAAKPKIAEYPFTTLVPNLGIVKSGTYSSFVIADIPGLITGAHLGKGLGDEFLRHIERTKVLVFMVDITSPDIRQDFQTLEAELRSFDPLLLKKPRLNILSKADLISPLPEDFSYNVDMVISSISGYNIDEFVKSLSQMLSESGYEQLKTDHFQGI